MATQHPKQRWTALFFCALGVQALSAQAPAPVTLAGVQRLTCSFTVMTTGTWDQDAPSAAVTKSTLSIQFDAIDTQDGTANMSGVSTGAAGAPHITARLLGENLHFLAMNSSGSVYMTSLFGDRESRTSGKFRAVHSRHEFTPVRLAGWTSRPSSNGWCDVGSDYFGVRATQRGRRIRLPQAGTDGARTRPACSRIRLPHGVAP